MLRIFDKPAGITTHTSLSSDERKRLDVDPIDSFLGHLSARSGLSLWPVHRLDLGTTGVLLAADNAGEAAELSQAFEARDVEKTYYFLTDGRLDPNVEIDTIEGVRQPIQVESFIDRKSGGKGTNFFSHPGTEAEPVNSLTAFELVSQHGDISLWKARPHTGRPHQIRLHAESLGLSILGDGEHGGTRFPVICLHAASIRLKWKGESIEASSPLPRWFSDLSLMTMPLAPRFINWLAAIERRERLARSLSSLGISPSETTRLIHTEGQDLRADRLGSIVQFHWYGDAFESSDRDLIETLARTMGWSDWYIQTRANRGKTPTESEIFLSNPDLPSRWSAIEESMTFTFRRDTSMSSGLFLDQRANRRWVLQNAHGLRVLNLFSYTSGFSVAAALAGASKVVSVDLSKNFLNWSKENFLANGLSIDDPKFEFRAMEARDFLKWAKKKALEFDLVICDPPSFARTEAGVFRIETALESLVEMCLDITASRGRVLFATNYELLREDEIFWRCEDIAARAPRPARVLRTPGVDLDFEFPREPRAMKSLFIEID